MKQFLLLTLFSLLLIDAYGQDFTPVNVNADQVNTQRYAKDTSASTITDANAYQLTLIKRN